MATQIELPTTIHVESAVSSDLAAALVRIGVDKATIYATLGNIVSVAIGPLTVALIATKLSPDLQGYYYTFGSVANVQFILEAGLSQTIIQFVSHEWPGLMMNATGVFNGDEGSKLRLVRLGRLHFGWNMISAVLLCVVLVGAGELLFPGGVLPPTEWRAPWIAFCLTVVMNFFISPTWALLQGCNQVSEYWLFRMIQQLVNGATLCAALAAGAGLWSLSIAGGMNLIWAMLFLRTRYPDFHRNFLTTGAHAPSWRTDIWPVQWRVALSWIASYITTQLFAPIVFRLSGPVDAGRVGMTSTIGLILLALSTNPVVTKATTFGMLSASGRNKELDKLFGQAFRTCIVTAMTGGTAVCVGVWALTAWHLRIGQRILSLPAVAMFMAAVVLNAAVLCVATYLRADKTERLAFVYGSSTVLILSLAWGLGLRYGTLGVVGGYLIVITLYTGPLAVRRFLSVRRTRITEAYPAELPKVST